MPAYKPASVTVPTTNKGQKTEAQAQTLELHDRTILSGTVSNSDGVLKNAGVRIYDVDNANQDNPSEVGIAFTDEKGIYQASVPVLADGHSYKIEIIAPAD
jgi:hypothetical protein